MARFQSFNENGGIIFDSAADVPVFLGKATLTDRGSTNNWTEYRSIVGRSNPDLAWQKYTFTAPNSRYIIPFVRTKEYCAITQCTRGANNVWTISTYHLGYATPPELWIFGSRKDVAIKPTDVGLILYDEQGNPIFSSSEKHIIPKGLASKNIPANHGHGFSRPYNSWPISWANQGVWAEKIPNFVNDPLVHVGTTEYSACNYGSYDSGGYFRVAKCVGDTIQFTWGVCSSYWYSPSTSVAVDQNMNVVVLDATDYT